MLKCAVCGANDEELRITQFVRIGKDMTTGRKASRRVNICDCCNAWGMASEEKLDELAGIVRSDS